MTTAQQILIQSITLLATGIVFALVFSFFSSVIYFVSHHFRGTLAYLVKTFAITLIAAPFLVLSLLGMLLFFISRIWARLQSIASQKKPISDTASQSAISENDVVVHLIHGTFEPKAEWTFNTSPMSKAINKINPDVTVTRFEWSGGNSRSARAKASNALAVEINNSTKRQHYIVAHSHAGNIVKEMLHAGSVSALKIKGICLLSTPFIFKQKMERTGGQLTLLHAMGFIVAMEALALSICWPLGVWGLPTASITFLCALVLELFLSNHFEGKLSGDKTDGVFHFENLKIMHAIGDEADSGLRSLSALHEACFGVFSQLASADRMMKAKSNRPYYILYSLQLAAAIGAYQFLDDPLFWLWSIAVSFGLAFFHHAFALLRPSSDVSSFLIMAALPVAVTAFYLNALKAFAYGDLRLIFSPNTFIYSSETPLGEHNITKYAPSSDQSLVHSTHSNTQAAQDIADWIHQSLHPTSAPIKPLPSNEVKAEHL